MSKATKQPGLLFPISDFKSRLKRTRGVGAKWKLGRGDRSPPASGLLACCKVYREGHAPSVSFPSVVYGRGCSWSRGSCASSLPRKCGASRQQLAIGTTAATAQPSPATGKHHQPALQRYKFSDIILGVSFIICVQVHQTRRF